MHADPSELKISLSGFSQQHYRRTHARGDVELVKRNMRLVRTLIDRLRLSTRVGVGHHLYRSNAHALEAVRGLCAELGFEHTPIQADYMPLERVGELLDGGTAALCCSVDDQANMLGAAFLDEGLEALERRKYAHPFCATCMRPNLHHAPAELSPGAA